MNIIFLIILNKDSLQEVLLKDEHTSSTENSCSILTKTKKISLENFPCFINCKVREL